MDFLKASIGYMYQYMMLKHITRTSRRTTAIREVIALRRRPWKRRLKSDLNRDYSNSSTLSNAGERFLSGIPKNHIQSQKEKEN